MFASRKCRFRKEAPEAGDIIVSSGSHLASPRAAGTYQFGICHEAGAPEIVLKIHAKMAAVT